MALTRSIFSALYVVWGRPQRISSSRLSLSSLNWAAYLATVPQFGALLPFANTSSSAMVCAETLSWAWILTYAHNSIFSIFHFFIISEVTKISITSLIQVQKISTRTWNVHNWTKFHVIYGYVIALVLLHLNRWSSTKFSTGLSMYIFLFKKTNYYA